MRNKEVGLQGDQFLRGSVLQQTRTIPIIFVLVADPVGNGFVASLPQPGGNATGFIITEGSLGGKWVELLKEIAPRTARIALLFNPATAPYAEYYLKPFKAAAPSFGVEAVATSVHLESVIATQSREPNSGLIVMPEPFVIAHRSEIISLAARYRLPAIYPYRFLQNLVAWSLTEMT
jgi:putative tryptophan/tyrosine transport system substrate-binding protein